jgi:hypothetical protein
METLRVYTEITDQRKPAAYSHLDDYMREVAAESASTTRITRRDASATDADVIPLRVGVSR